MDECICCGATVPEGRMICLICEKGKELPNDIARLREELKEELQKAK